MWVLFGWVVGDLFARTLLSRAVMLMAVWLVVPFAAYAWGTAHFGLTGGYVAEFATFGAMLVFALHRPFSSTWKLTLVDGLLIWCRVMTVLSAVKTAMHLFGVLYDISFFLALAWAIRGAMAFGISKAIYWWLSRDVARIAEG